MNPRIGPILFAGLYICMAIVTSGCSSATPRAASSAPSIPTIKAAAATASPADTGSWRLLNAKQVTAESTTIRIGVTRNACASGITGKVLEPQVQVEASRIVIRAVLEAQKPGGYFCPSNNIVPITVKLPGPIGHHNLFDAVCLDSHQSTMPWCDDDQGVRWKP